MNTHKITTLVEELADVLRNKKVIVSTAESCTGGMVAEFLTSIPNSSVWFDRAFITYSNYSKTNMLGVKPETLKKHGAVSKNCVMEMAQGVIINLLSDEGLVKNNNNNHKFYTSIAISGIAGPSGGTAKKPVGTVWIACALYEITTLQDINKIITTTQLFTFSGNRSEIREQATLMALDNLKKSLNF